MPLSDRRSLLILALVAVAAASWWLTRGGDGDRVTAMLPGGGPLPDYALVDFTLTEMDETGRPGHTLVAENLYHYPDRAESVLDRPRIRFFEEGREAWDVSAEQGVVSDADRSVFLSGDVRVRHHAGATPERGFQILTGELNVWPDERRAATGDAVTILHHGGITRSIGMTAELDARQVHLLSEVRSRYAP